MPNYLYCGQLIIPRHIQKWKWENQQMENKGTNEKDGVKTSERNKHTVPEKDGKKNK